MTPRPTLRRWLPTLLAVLPFVLCLASGLVSQVLSPSEAPEPFPRLLIPAGAMLQSMQAGATEHCYAHTVARVGPVRLDLATRWARDLDLPCEADVDAGATCAGWSTARRAHPFWSRDDGEPEGLDTVRAQLDGSTLVVDWGDSLCSGPM